MWSGLPRNLTHVDAVYERPDKKIAFFVGEYLIVLFVDVARKLDATFSKFNAIIIFFQVKNCTYLIHNTWYLDIRNR